MKKWLLLLTILWVSNSHAQLNTKENGVTLDLGVGATIHSIYNNVTISKGENAFANLFHFNLRYKTGLLGYGIKLEHLKFATNNDSSDVFKNAIGNLLQFNTSFTFLEKKKINIYLMTGIGVGSLHYERLDTSGNFGKIKMQGFSASAALGINYHFKGKFGIFAQVGYIYNVEHLTDYRINGTSIEEFENRELKDVLFNMRGLDFKTGIRFAF